MVGGDTTPQKDWEGGHMDDTTLMHMPKEHAKDRENCKRDKTPST